LVGIEDGGQQEHAKGDEAMQDVKEGELVIAQPHGVDQIIVALMNLTRSIMLDPYLKGVSDDPAQHRK
jgi:hypothetical protein